MKRYLIAWLGLFLAALGGWYLVGMLELGVADGTGVAPWWLYALRGAELVLLFPLGLLVLSIVPAIGDFALSAFLLLAFAVGVNSALLVVAAALGQRIASNALAARDRPPRNDH
jgi:hypothetical protein